MSFQKSFQKSFQTPFQATQRPGIAPAVMDTVVAHLALLFRTGTAGGETAERDAARATLAAYAAETEEELRLAAGIISFGFHALEALSQAAAPDLSLNRVLRLRGSAVSLSRESHKAQRKLDQLQRARRAAAESQPAEAPPAESQPADPKAAPGSPAPHGTPTPTQPQIERAIDLIAFAQEAIEAAGKNQGQTWTQSFQKRQTAKRIAENMKKNQARHAARLNVQPPAAEDRSAA
jgi:hypothetical protein